MESLLFGLAAGAAKFFVLSHQRPDAPLEERLRDAALFAGGNVAGMEATLALVRRGNTPTEAAALVAGVGAVGALAANDTPIAPLTHGVVTGAAAGGIGSALAPNWPLGLKPRVFISHAFAHTPQYLDLKEALQRGRLSWFDHSVPMYDQFETSSNRVLKEALRGQIRGTSAVVLLAGPGVAARPCIRDEIEMAIESLKPILVVDQSPNLASAIPPVLRSYPLVRRVAMTQPGSLVTALAGLVTRARALR